jgi:branched-chain amino acid transport system permease protein
MTAQAPALLRSGETRQSIIFSAVFGALLLILPFIVFPLNTALIVLFSGLYLGMLYFLVGAGMAIVFGLLDVLNFAQGSFFMLGAYVGFEVYQRFPGLPVGLRFVIAIVAAILTASALGAVIEIALLRPLYKRPVFQIVLTFGLAMMITEIIRTIYGPAGFPTLDKPVFLDRSLTIAGAQFQVYWLFIIVVGALLMIGITLLLKRTRLGIIIRAGVQDAEMVQALGINVRSVFTLVFVLGAAVAALGGIVAAPIMGGTPAMGSQFLLIAVIVIVIGGMSSFEGSAVAAMLMGMTYSIAQFVSVQFFNTPVIASVSLLVLMVVVLLIRPSGLFGRE